MKAVVLFSGGLDSLLTTRILQEQGITVVGVNIITPFVDGSLEAQKRADEMGIELKICHLGQEYMDMLKKPRWGIGKAINPCIDCRIMMCHAAKKVMEEVGAEFLATGEVAGQRPNSQKIHQLNLISRESGLHGKLVRPLSAKVLSPSEPEQKGFLDRNKLFTFTGRFRVGLISMARYRYEIPVIPQPSTGCLLCEGSFAPKVRDLLNFKERPTCWDAKLLNAGRQIRIDERTKCSLGRSEADCDLLTKLYARPDRSPSFLLSPHNFQGPAVILVNDLFADSVNDLSEWNEDQNRYLHLAGGMILAHTRPDKWRNVAHHTLGDLVIGDKHFVCRIEPDSAVERFKIIKAPEKSVSVDDDSMPVNDHTISDNSIVDDNGHTGTNLEEL